MNAWITPARRLGLDWPRLVVAVVLCVNLSGAQAGPLATGAGVQGFVVLAEQRFDPALQRYMAERSLAALPLRSGRLYYVYPMHNSNAQLEGMQIQYLEALLEKRAAENQQTQESDEPESD